MNNIQNIKQNNKQNNNYNNKYNNKIAKFILDNETKTHIVKFINGIDSIKKHKSKTKSKINFSNTIFNKYVIAIPTYKRADTIINKTLKLLKNKNISPDKIILFVANQEEYNEYSSKVPRNMYKEIIIGKKGLKEQRNFITDYFPSGTQIVQMDDDLEEIYRLIVKGEKRTLKPVEHLDEFIKLAFQICKKNKIFLWGVYPLANSRFMSTKVTTDLRFIVGPFWGMINRHSDDLKLTLDEKENSERTLQYFMKDGAVLRFNNIGVETKYYSNKGGMQAEMKNRKEEAMKSVLYLHEKYPKITKINLKKKSGVPEIRLLRITKKEN